MVSVEHIGNEVGWVFFWRGTLKLAYGVPKIEVISSFRTGNLLGNSVLCVLEIAIEHHSFASAVPEVPVHLQTVVFRVLLHLGNRTAECSGVWLSVRSQAWRKAVFAVMVSVDRHSLDIVEIIAHLACRHSPPESVSRVNIVYEALG